MVYFRKWVIWLFCHTNGFPCQPNNRKHFQVTTKHRKTHHYPVNVFNGQWQNVFRPKQMERQCLFSIVQMQIKCDFRLSLMNSIFDNFICLTSKIGQEVQSRRTIVVSRQNTRKRSWDILMTQSKKIELFSNRKRKQKVEPF